MPALPVELNVSKTPPRATVPDWLKDKVRRRIVELVELARRELQRTILLPTVSFDLSGQVAGRAYPGRNHLQFNAALLVENVQAFLTDTVPHELAHLLAHLQYGGHIEPHGREWAKVMTGIFGLPATRTHRLDTARSTAGDVLYRYRCCCPGLLHDLTVRRHNAVQLRGARYLCKACRGVLRYVGVRDLVAERAAAPTSAQIAFASLLADKAGLTLPDAARRDKHACRKFIEAHRGAEAPAQPVEPTTEQPSGVPPTEKQLAFARRLATQANVAIPPAVCADRRLLSRWIDGHLTPKPPAGGAVKAN